MASLTLHKDFGVNPTVPLCFWCGEMKNEVAMLGNKLKTQAPPKMVLDYVPCEKCQDKMKLGITCMEVDSTTKLKRMPLAREGAMSVVAPTGSWCVVNIAAMKRLISDNLKLGEIIRSGRCVLEVAVYQSIFGEALKEKKDGVQVDQLRVRKGAKPRKVRQDVRLPKPAKPAP
jgi:hypothetical protein